MPTVTSKMTNLQQELLKLFSIDIDEKELLEIKEILTKFFANRVMNEADKIWNEKGFSDKEMDRLLHDNKK